MLCKIYKRNFVSDIQNHFSLQVLLISGGESLDNDEKVCKYNAGTDTNPIFLFNLANIENANAGEGDETGHGGFELVSVIKLLTETYCFK